MYYLHGDHGAIGRSKLDVLVLISIECANCANVRLYNASGVAAWIARNPEGGERA
jgi:hypothetical protein